jgi:hypothetical protein
MFKLLVLNLRKKKFCLFHLNRLDACHKSHEIKLKGRIMNRRLCLLHPKNEEELQKLNFGSCFYGCDLTALAILYNDSPESVAYSALIDDSKPTVRFIEQKKKYPNKIFLLGF